MTLNSQGLLKREQLGRGINAIQKTIDQLHYVQIDTISVVERAHHHVLRSRIRNYKPEMLHKLLAERRSVFEYWAHAASYLPMEDYRFYQPIMKGFAGKNPGQPKIRKEIVRRIQSEGPLQSRDFEAPAGHKSGGWWDWKPAKRELEYMFLSGDLMVCERQGFQKVYDLKENVIPGALDISWPTDSERGQFYIRRMLKSLGLASARDIGYARPTLVRLSGINIQPGINSSLPEMVESGEVTQIEIAGRPYYCLTRTLDELPKKLGPKRVTILSPFDNLVINRRRLLELFNFDYQIECYVPANKRKFGYFALPVLYGDSLVGRMDCKAERNNRLLRINKIWLEPKTKLSEQLVSAFGTALTEYMVDLDADSISIQATEPEALKQQLEKNLTALI